MWLDNSSKKLPGKGANEGRQTRGEGKYHGMKRIGGAVRVGPENVLEKMQKECLRSTFLDRIPYTLKYSWNSFTGLAVNGHLAWPRLWAQG